MNREILFRGKRVDTGEWVYGGFVGSKYICTYLGKVPDILCNPIRFFPIGTLTLCEVIPKTVGQFTSISEVWEDDIITNIDTGEFQTVYWNEDEAAWYCKYHSSDRIVSLSDSISNCNIVTSNIHDNPPT